MYRHRYIHFRRSCGFFFFGRTWQISLRSAPEKPSVSSAITWISTSLSSGDLRRHDSKIFTQKKKRSFVRFVSAFLKDIYERHHALTMLLRCCYDAVTLLRCCHRALTMLLRCCHALTMLLTMLSRSYDAGTTLLQCCHDLRGTTLLRCSHDAAFFKDISAHICLLKGHI
jgi:hypothetical protein